MNIKGLLSSAYSKTLNAGQTVYSALPGKSSAAKLGQSILTTCKANPVKLTGLVALLGAGTTVVVLNKNRIGSPMPFLKETWGKTTSKVSDLYNSYVNTKNELAKVKRENDALKALRDAGALNLAIATLRANNAEEKLDALKEELSQLHFLAQNRTLSKENQREIVEDLGKLVNGQAQAVKRSRALTQ
ncbi:MAG: hypothetical protein ChlgKO_14210 [Chlamydiales bacterium]